MFSFVSSLSPDKNKVGAVQAACLLIVTLGTLIYTIYKARIKTYHISNPVVCVCIGVFLGILSSFLGIGGGPINLVILFFFFSMTTVVCVCIGVFLGILSSFLGIGGGPINLVILFFFFSMTTKVAAENSLYVIFFSQLASLLSSLATRSVPDFQVITLIFMVVGGIAGGAFGRKVNKKIEDKTVDKLFIGLMVLIILINIYNIIKFVG